MRRTRPSQEWEQSTDPETRAALDRLGAQVKELRATMGWSQRDLAARCRVDQGTISRFERGLAPGVRAVSVARMIRALDGRLVPAKPDMARILRADG
jgi:ribosome-binding protein aMBF1 (putative translation factor)